MTPTLLLSRTDGKRCALVAPMYVYTFGYLTIYSSNRNMTLSRSSTISQALAGMPWWNVSQCPIVSGLITARYAYIQDIICPSLLSISLVPPSLAPSLRLTPRQIPSTRRDSLYLTRSATSSMALAPPVSSCTVQAKHLGLHTLDTCPPLPLLETTLTPELTLPSWVFLLTYLLASTWIDLAPHSLGRMIHIQRMNPPPPKVSFKLLLEHTLSNSLDSLQL